MSLITCREVSFSYEGKEVISHLNFSVDAGDYLCVIGRNGAGKSTLIKGLLGLKKPDGGDISYEKDFSCTQVGYLPQQTLVQKDFPTSVMEVVLSGFLNRHGMYPFYTRKEKERAIENLAFFGMSESSGLCYRDLSGGQQQRVLLARALCATQKLLLLDEPVTGLDPVMAAEMYQYVKKLNDEKKLTIIMVSHDVRQAITYATKVLQLGDGQEYFGSRKDFERTPQWRQYIQSSIFDES